MMDDDEGQRDGKISRSLDLDRINVRFLIFR